MNQAAAPSIIPVLRRQLVQRIEELDAERAAICRALRVLAPEPAKPTQDLLEHRVLKQIAEEPGVRASMLALHLSVAQGRVLNVLRELEGAGTARREGLGWSAASISA
jgi:hypothetical protein